MRLIAIALLLFASSAQAQYTEILILDEHYSTTNKVTDNDPDCFVFSRCPPGTVTTTTTQQANSTTPLERELVVQSWRATSTADTFSVSADAYGWAHAAAQTSFTFRVLQDTSTLLTFDGALTSWSWGSFSLLDQTTGTSLFSQTFGFPGQSGDPNSVWPGNLSSVSFSGLLDSDHLYKLTLRGDADDQYDGGWRMSLSVNGLYAIAAPVPEPEAYALMLAGLAFVGFAVRRRRV